MMRIDGQQRATPSTPRAHGRLGRAPDPAPHPGPDRVLVPVLAGTGGAGRSSLCALVAQRLAATQGTAVVLDRAPERLAVAVLADRPGRRPPARGAGPAAGPG
jgi:hypothetical protein